MPIVGKSNSIKYLKIIDEKVSRLRTTITGDTPNDGIWNLYALNENDFERDFTEVNDVELSCVLGELDSLIKELKKVKTLKADKLHNSS